jgi:hypothetical protein
MTDREDELRLRHVEHIQSVITRLAQNSFTIRGWSVSLVSVVLAIFASTDGTQALAPVTLVPTAVFWGLDAYYVRQERLYRRLYAAIGARLINGPSTGADTADPAPFDMDVNRYAAAVPSLGRTLVTPIVLTIPAVVFVGVVAYLVGTSFR